MVDLIVPAGTVLKIDQPSQVEPQYGLFSMEANAKILTLIDLTIKASRAEFAVGCVIDASGPAGPNGSDGARAPTGAKGGSGTNGLPGQNGRNVAIEAGLAKVGGLTIITDGGAGGNGGAGGFGGLGQTGGPQGAFDRTPGIGGDGGSGAPGGDAGKISLVWTRLAANLPSVPGTSPPGHVYRSNGGIGGSGGAGGAGGSGGPAYEEQGPAGANGATGANGKGLPVQVTWRGANLAALLWVQKQDMGPAPRAYHDIAFDPGRGMLVLFGGLVAGKASGDTWEWDGRLWIQVADTGPAPRAYHAMAYDSVGQRILLFGGSDGAPVASGAQDQPVYFGDTWAWDGQDWVQLADTGPSPRQSHAMTCDAGRSRVVLFSGGQISSQTANVAVADTWEWNGVDWAQVGDTGPAARLNAKLAAVQGGVLLFGGTGVGPAPGDTWRWDGHQWLQVADTGPAPRIGHAMASDGLVAFVFGGELLATPDGSPRIVNDTWAWSDQNWRQIQDIGPSPRAGHAMANVTSAEGDHITLYGGQAPNAFGDTWRLEDRS
jgi:hypothetical protein